MRTFAIAGLRQQGFSLIEILVAVFVLSIGLLGMAALMATSLRNAHSSNQRTLATNLAYEMIDAIRANLINAGRYSVPAFSDAAALCPAGTTKTATLYPAATAPHVLELQRWLTDVCYTLPNGRGRVIIARNNVTVAASGESFAVYNVTVDVCWFDDRESTDAADCDNATPGPDTVISVGSSL